MIDENSKIPPGMVRVSPANYFKTLFIPGYEGMPGLALSDYWIDRFEVTNHQFRAFVDQGGYQNQQYWKQKFLKDGEVLPRDHGMALFQDSTGRPIPKDWDAGRLS